MFGPLSKSEYQFCSLAPWICSQQCFLQHHGAREVAYAGNCVECDLLKAALCISEDVLSDLPWSVKASRFVRKNAAFFRKSFQVRFWLTACKRAGYTNLFSMAWRLFLFVLVSRKLPLEGNLILLWWIGRGFSLLRHMIALTRQWSDQVDRRVTSWWYAPNVCFTLKGSKTRDNFIETAENAMQVNTFFLWSFANWSMLVCYCCRHWMAMTHVMLLLAIRKKWATALLKGAADFTNIGWFLATSACSLCTLSWLVDRKPIIFVLVCNRSFLSITMAKVNWMSAYILLLNKADPHATTQLWNGQNHCFFYQLCYSSGNLSNLIFFNGLTVITDR